MLSEDFHRITFLAVDACHINHRHVHTDVAYIISFLTIDKTISMSIAESAVQAIGITDRNGCNHTILIKNGLATVTYTISRLHMVHLQDGSLQGAHAVDCLIVAGVDSIKSKT